MAQLRWNCYIPVMFRWMVNYVISSVNNFNPWLDYEYHALVMTQTAEYGDSCHWKSVDFKKREWKNKKNENKKKSKKKRKSGPFEKTGSNVACCCIWCWFFKKWKKSSLFVQKWKNSPLFVGKWTRVRFLSKNWFFF